MAKTQHFAVKTSGPWPKSSFLGRFFPQDAIIFGVETHVCVQQTALDLMDRGIQALKNHQSVAEWCFVPSLAFPFQMLGLYSDWFFSKQLVAFDAIVFSGPRAGGRRVVPAAPGPPGGPGSAAAGGLLRDHHGVRALRVAAKQRCAAWRWLLVVS